MKRKDQDRNPADRPDDARDAERGRITQTYRQVVQSIREAHSLQSVIEKEQQLRRLMRHLRHRPGAAAGQAVGGRQ